MWKKNKNCQFSSTTDKTLNNNEDFINSSIVPYILIEKELISYHKRKEQEFLENNFLHYDLIFCFNKNSHHLNNFKKLQNVGSAVFGFQSPISHFFSDAKLYAPRSVLSIEIEVIEPKDNLFEYIWDNFFKKHPNVKVSKDNCKLGISKRILTSFYVDYGGNMNGIKNICSLLDEKCDPFVDFMYNMAIKYNNNPIELEIIVKNGFGLNLDNKFIHDINRTGIYLMGNSQNEWKEYFLDFGEEIKKETQLIDFLLKFHQ